MLVLVSTDPPRICVPDCYLRPWPHARDSLRGDSWTSTFYGSKMQDEGISPSKTFSPFCTRRASMYAVVSQEVAELLGRRWSDRPMPQAHASAIPQFDVTVT